MPIYEYRCGNCKRKTSLFLRSLSDKKTVICPHCKSRTLKRIFSRFVTARSEESRLESLSDPSKWGGLDENDPRSIARFAKRMGKEIGEEVGEDFDQMVEEELEKGTPPNDDSTSED